jgi:hypothetical protein
MTDKLDADMGSDMVAAGDREDKKAKKKYGKERRVKV